MQALTEFQHAEPAVRERAAEIFEEHRQWIYKRTDHLFAFLTVIQLVACFIAAYVISPRTWTGTETKIHPHIWASFIIGGLIASFPIYLALKRPGEWMTRHTMAAAQMMISGLLIHLTGGRIETHFHIFGSLAFLAFYRDWKVFIPATIVVTLDHLLRGIYFPLSIYGVLNASPWRTFEHAGWVVFEETFLIRFCVMKSNEMLEIAETRANLEHTNETIETRVRERTVELKTAEAALLGANKELATAHDEAVEANRSKSVFLANMSHELRTPLNAILGYSEILQEESEDTGQIAIIPDLKRIHGAGKHLLTLINDILDLSKIEAGRMEVYLEDFDLLGLIEEVASTVKPLIEKNNNTLKLECAPDLGIVRSDLIKTKQILLNLLSNASKFTENGTVTLKALREKLEGADWITLKVFDSGIGMTPEQQQKLFKEFMQADASTTRKFGGTGLGLAISQHFARAIGGTINVKSAPGEGSCFVLRIPARAAEKAAPPRQKEYPAAVEAVAPAGPLTKRILVIDDDPAIRDLMKRSLGKEGFEVHTASAGEEGITLARKIMPDAITLDVMMPGKDGWTVLSELKADRDLQHIPVIIATMVENRTMGYALGAAEYMMKPIDRERLVGICGKLCKKGAARRALLIEDTADARDLIQRALEREGWSVSAADNGKSGLARLKEALPDIILLDLMMPEMNGFEFLTELRAKPEWKTIPVVVITAKELTKEERARLTGNVQGVLQKGLYTREELLREIGSLAASCKPAPRGESEIASEADRKAA